MPIRNLYRLFNLSIVITCLALSGQSLANPHDMTEEEMRESALKDRTRPARESFGPALRYQESVDGAVAAQLLAADHQRAQRNKYFGLLALLVCVYAYFRFFANRPRRQTSANKTP